ncbi:transglycosylase family protein [Nakamurella sp. GG22]
MRFFDADAVRAERSTGTVTRSALTALALAVGLVLALSFIPGGNVAAADPSASDWQRLRVCESGDNYTINTGNGYYGAYQFDLGTWRSVGGTGYPHQASKATQDALALELWRQRGWSPWACAAIVGLTGGTAALKGTFDSAVPSTVAARVVGWAYDTAAPSVSIGIRISVNGASSKYTANRSRSDINRIFGISGAHGFVVSVPLAQGRSNEICVWAIGTKGNERSMGCRSVRPVPAAPRGSIDSMVSTEGVVSVKGWSYDPNVPGTSNRVHIYVNSTGYSRLANKSRSDVNRIFGITGSHGLSETVPLRLGSNQVCAYGIDLTGDGNPKLRCATVMTRYPPIGSFDKLTASGLTGSVGGWVLDPNSSSTSIRVHVYVNGRGYSLTADRLRADVNRVHAVSGSHGFLKQVPLLAGANKVCVYAIGVTAGNNTLVSCRTVNAVAPTLQRLAAAAPPEDPSTVVPSATSAASASTSASADPATTAAPPSSAAATTAAATSAAPTSSAPESGTTTEPAPTTAAPTTSTSTTGSASVESVPTTTVPGSFGASTGTSGSVSMTTGAPPSTVQTTPVAPPVAKGALEALQMNGRIGTLTGWIADAAATPRGSWVRITVNGVTHDVLAATARPDLPDAGGSVPLGFTDAITFAPGSNEVCLYEIDKAGGLSTAPIACRTEVVR